ncbi:MAG: hypothetical protein ACFFCZ_29385 [Promethearchaeota archaeon]
MLDDIKNMCAIPFNEVREILSNLNISLIAFKQTDRLMSKIQGWAGFTQIGEGTIVPILDPTKLARAI